MGSVCLRHLILRAGADTDQSGLTPQCLPTFSLVKCHLQEHHKQQAGRQGWPNGQGWNSSCVLAPNPGALPYKSL